MGWRDLLSIRDEARALRAQEAAAPLSTCPICATPLQVNSRGGLDCPWGDWSSSG